MRVFIVLCGVLMSAAIGLAHDYRQIVFSQDGTGDSNNNGVMWANPATGDREVISQPTVRGDGPDFGSLIGGLSIDRDGNILLLNSDAGIVFRIDPLNGDRSIIASDTVGTGPSFSQAQGLIVDAQGAIVVTSGFAHALVRIDPLSGNRTILSGPDRGSGRPFSAPYGVAQSDDGNFYVYDANDETVTQVDASTGNRTLVSGAGTGAGPAFDEFGSDLVVLKNGDLATANLHTIFRVNTSNGNREILSGPHVGNGPQLERPDYLTLAADGALIASDMDGIFRVDPVTGDRELLTGTAFGSGPSIGIYREAIAIVPEPSACVLLSLSSVTIWARHRSRTCSRRTQRHRQ